MINGQIGKKNNDLEDIVVITAASFDEVTIPSNENIQLKKDFSENIPTGYKALGCYLTSSGSYWWYCVSLYFDCDTNSAQIYVRNTYTVQDSGRPSIGIICLKVI